LKQRGKMDYSDIYINMSDKAKEIQFEHSVFEVGDFYFEGRDVITNKPRFSLTSESFDGKNRTIADMKTWLPRQDQLLPIIGDYSEQCKILYRNLMKEFLLPNSAIISMEQLLLIIVMREKYSKVWNGIDWVKHKQDS
jgi:hypothetical protein